MSVEIDERSLEELIQDTFERCDECGTWFQQEVGWHRCTERRDAKRTVDEREARQVAMEASEFWVPDEPVIVKPAARHGAYHKPANDAVVNLATRAIVEGMETKFAHEFKSGEPACAAILSNEDDQWAALRMEDAHASNRYPCGHCWPELDR